MRRRTSQNNHVKCWQKESVRKPDFFREVSHLGSERCNFALGASDSLRLNWPQNSSKYHNGKLLNQALRYSTPCLLCKCCRYKGAKKWRLSSKRRCFTSKVATSNYLVRLVTWSSWFGPMKGEHVTNTEVFLIGDDFNELCFSGGNDSVYARKNSQQSASESSSRFDAMMVTCAVSVVISWFTFYIISVSVASSFDLNFVITSVQGINGQLEMPMKSGPLNQLLSNRAVANNPQVPALQGYHPSKNGSIRQLSSVPEFQSHGWQRRQAVFQAKATIVVRLYCQSKWNIFRYLMKLQVNSKGRGVCCNFWLRNRKYSESERSKNKTEYCWLSTQLLSCHVCELPTHWYRVLRLITMFAKPAKN